MNGKAVFENNMAAEEMRVANPIFELTQSRAYQIRYQKALKTQIEAILDKLQRPRARTL